MIASQVLSKEQLEAWLKGLGYEPTEETTKTGRFWKNKTTGKHLQVPYDVQGFYPSWLLQEMELEAWKINPWPINKNHQ